MQNIASGESFGAGVRVLANGTWGFAATNVVTEASLTKVAQTAVAIAKANAKVQKEKVQLASQKGYGEVMWKTPIKQNAFEVPVVQKVELLLAANARATDNGTSFVNSSLFQINEQKYFASTDGSYIDQDVHRIWPTFSVTGIDRSSGKFRSRDALSAPMGLGYEYLTPNAADKIPGAADSRLGLGAVVVSTVPETFRWGLQGHAAVYASFWNQLLRAAVPPAAPAAVWHAGTRWPRPAQPLTLHLAAGVLPTVQPSVAPLAGGPAVSLALRQDSRLPEWSRRSCGPAPLWQAPGAWPGPNQLQFLRLPNQSLAGPGFA